MLDLVVKGTALEAVSAAASRGIYPDSVVKLMPPGEVVLRVQEGYLARVVEWLYEPPRDAPYPVGTLLFYATHQPGRTPLTLS